jgi:hypothetical protein
MRAGGRGFHAHAFRQRRGEIAHHRDGLVGRAVIAPEQTPVTKILVGEAGELVGEEFFAVVG